MKKIMTALCAATAAAFAFVAPVLADEPEPSEEIVLEVTDVSFRQRYPWNGLVDIDCTVNCSDPTTNITLHVSAKDGVVGKVLNVRSVWLEDDITHTNALSVTAGSYRLVWDAGRDNQGFVGNNVVVTVRGVVNGSQSSARAGGDNGAVRVYESSMDYFLGNDYFEIGLTCYGALGSCSYAPTSGDIVFHPYLSYLSLISLLDYSITTDFFLPAYQNERWEMYEDGYNVASGLTRGGSSGIFNSEFVNESTETLVDVSVINSCYSDFTVEHNVSFSSDNLGYLMTVRITNKSDSEKTNVSYVRRCDPDQASCSWSGTYSPSTDNYYYKDANDNVYVYAFSYSTGVSESDPESLREAMVAAGSAPYVMVGIASPEYSIAAISYGYATSTYNWHSYSDDTEMGLQFNIPSIPAGGTVELYYIGTVDKYVNVTEADPFGGYGISYVSGSGESDASILDLNTGTRIAEAGVSDVFVYSSRWGDAEACSVEIDGEEVVSGAVVEGEMEWTPTEPGAHVLTHTAGDTIYTAQFTVLDEDVAVHGGALTENEVWSADKVHLVTSAVTVPEGFSLFIEPGAIVKFMPGTSLTVSSYGSCTAEGVIFTHVNDDTAGGDTLMDGDETEPVMGEYNVTGSIYDDDDTEYRYLPPQTLSSYISYDTRLRGYRTYIVSNSVTVAYGATLTLKPGTIFKFAPGISMTVNGTLDAQGTRAAPVIFTSLKDDEHGGDTNCDGDATYPEPGDWSQIKTPGTAKFNYSHVLYCSSIENTGAIDAYGGTATFDNGVVAHTIYECVNAHSSGNFTARNSVFWDTSLGFGYYGSGRVKAYNCVFAEIGNAAAIRQSGKLLVNCIFYKCYTAFTDQGGDGSTFRNCCFYNPPGYGPQSYSKVGTNGNIWADPLFNDPDNGDFTIASNSPCIDAGDGSVAPELDSWGQPRMDVAAIADTGKPDSDGICPDIGIYEAMGIPATPVADLAAEGLYLTSYAPDGFLVGDTITFIYAVTNRGKEDAVGIVRDMFRFRGADATLGGIVVDAGTINQPYHIPAGATAEMTASLKIPTLSPGAWDVEVTVNAERDIFEVVTANNSAETSWPLNVNVEAVFAGGSKTLDVAAHGTAGFSVSGLSTAGGAIVAALPSGLTMFASVGYMPSAALHDVAGTLLDDGRIALFIPAHSQGENIYVTVVNDAGASQTVELVAYATSEGLEVARPADVAIISRGPNVTATLSLPETVRDGRIYAAWVEYANVGTEDADLPIFTVSRTGGGAMLSASSKGEYSASPLPLVGLAPSAPRGKLKPGEAGRVAFYILSSGDLSLRLSMVTDQSTSILNGFDSTAEYAAAMSAAATRLTARGGNDPDFSAILAQALNEKRDAGGGAIYGTLKHSITHLPLAGIEMHLVSTNDDSVVSTAVTDDNGRFVLTTEAPGDYAVDVRNVLSFTPCIMAMEPGEDKQTVVTAVPLSSVSGVVSRPDSFGVASGAAVVLDNLATAEPEDRVAETDDAGRYSFADVVDGEYRLSLYPQDGYAIVETEEFSVSNGVALVRNLAYGAKGRIVSGVVSDVETGLGVSNAVLMISRDGTCLGVTTDEKGEYSFEGLAEGRWGLSLQANEHQIDGISSLDVLEGEGEQVVNIPARVKCPFAVLRPVGMAPHDAKFAMVREDVVDLAWDFDSDGIVDSTATAPEWTYYYAGNYSVTLYYTDGYGVRRSSLWTDAVKVVAAFDNILKPNAVLVSEAAGVVVESVSDTELVLSGDAVAYWTASGTVLGAETSPKGGFISRVVAAENIGGSRWRFMVERAALPDLFERYYTSGDISLSGAKMKKLFSDGDKGTKAAGGDPEASHGSAVSIPSHDPDVFHQLPTLTYSPWFSDLSASVTGSFSAWKDDVIKGSWGAIVYDGELLMSWYSAVDIYQATVTASCSCTRDWTQGVTGKESVSKGWNQSWADWPIGWGFTLSLQTDEDLVFAVEGSGTLTCEQSLKARRTQTYYFDEDGELDNSVTIDWGATVSTKRSVTGTVSASIDASLTLGLYASFAKVLGRAGGGPKVGAKLALSQNLEAGYETSYSIGSSGLDAGVEPVAESKLKLEFTPYVGVNISWKWLNTPKAKKYDVDLPLKMEWPNEASVGKLGMEVSGHGLTKSFVAQNPKIEASGYVFKNLLGLDGLEVPANKFLWGLGDGTLLQEGRSITHTYAKPGKYKVRLFGESPIPATLITYTGSPFIRTTVQWIDVFDDKPPEPQEPQDDGSGRKKQSWDPNEMEGPAGVGESRMVKPGEWMTYTVYFENKAEADVPAQEIRVTNPLDKWLDWSSLEMRDVGFCNQVETGLAGMKNGSITVNQDNTDYQVQVNVSVDETDGAVEWYLRSVDPNRADYNYWPPDGEGLLPPNDATGRGEGHLTYRIKVREDAPMGVVVTNSAVIVFDYNPAIETDPAWWNTVAEVTSVKMSVDGIERTLSLIVGQPYGELPEPLPREGYVFGGWYTGPGGTGERVNSQTIVKSGDSSLYEYWLTNAYMVRFNANGGTGVMSSQAFVFDTPQSLDGCGFEREGYSFMGWSVSADGEVVYGDRDIVVNLASDEGAVVNLYAIWLINSYEVTFDANGGTGGWSKSMVFGAPLVAPEVVLPGYVLKGWSPALDATVPSHDVTYVAQWEHDYLPIVTFDANGGVGGWSRAFEAGSTVAAPTVTRKGYEFAGWSPAFNGVVPSKDVTYVAQWERIWIRAIGFGADGSALYGEPSLASGSVWNGWIVDAADSLKGVLQVKVGKPNKKSGEAKVTANVTMAGAKKEAVAMTPISADKSTSTGKSKSGVALALEFGETILGGTYGNWRVFGSLDDLSSKDKSVKAAADAALAKWLGPVNVAWPAADGWNTLTVTIAKKGKVKAAGSLPDGSKLSGTGQVSQGDEWSAVPVIVTKKTPVSLMLWLGADGNTVEIDGLGIDAVAGRPMTLGAKSVFDMDVDAFVAKFGDATFRDFLPQGVVVSQAGAKWNVPKAGKIVYQKGTQTVDAAKAGDNPSALKLAYQAKTGAFKGSFKVYTDNKGKPKGIAAKLAGVMVKGVAYGSASLKKIMNFPFTIK